MKIKKIYQGSIPENKILNAHSTSQTDTYSCEKINEMTERETITNDNGTAIKFPDGTMLVTQQYTRTVQTWNNWGNLYSQVLDAPPNFPVQFVTKPVVTQSLETLEGNGNGWIGTATENVGIATEIRAGAVQVIRASSSSTNTFNINVIAVGRWK